MYFETLIEFYCPKCGIYSCRDVIISSAGIMGSKCQPSQKIDLIVTDMHYPMAPRTKPDENAGFKLIERLKKEHLYIPVIICSSINYNVPEILGTVWYNKLRDLNLDFKELLELHV